MKEKIVKRLKCNSFQTKLLIRMSLVITVVILLMSLMLNELIKQRLQADQISVQHLKMERCLLSLDYYFMNLMAKTDMVFFNQTLSDVLETNAGDLLSRAHAAHEIGSMTDVMFFNLKYPEVKTSYYFGGQVGVCIYTKNPLLYQDNKKIFSYHSVENAPFVKELLNEKRTFSWNHAFSIIGERYLALNRRILSTRDLRDIAIFQLRVPLSKISDILQQNSEDAVDYFAYADKEGEILISNAPSSIFTEILDRNPARGTILRPHGLKDNYVVGVTDSLLNDYRLITATSMTPIYRSVGFITPIIFVTGVIAILCCGFFCFLASASMTKGIHQLTQKTRVIAKTGRSGYTMLQPIHATDEITELDEAFHKMLETIDELYQRESQYQKTINEVQAELLQEQFNPHLLYNTLSIIRHMEQEQGQLELYDVTDNLISFYKCVLNRGQIITMIKDEMIMIRHYLCIVQKVYDIALTIKIDIEDAVLSFYSIKLFLQPIVENAVLHGLRQIGGGTLCINGKIKKGNLLFSISDDGVGIEPEVKEGISAVLEGRSDNQLYHSYGYVSVAKRLTLFFGSTYTMSIQSEPGEGTTVFMTMPALKETDVNDYLKGTFV